MSEQNPVRTAKHEAARAAAKAGLFPFPCKTDKKPGCPNGFYDGTNDLEQIDRWWSEADYNPAVSPGRISYIVVDTDPPSGEDNLAALEVIYGKLPETWTIKTPRGGRHRWFKGTCNSSAGKLGENIDVRSYLGYVLLPGSTTDDGEYTAENDLDAAECPPWIIEEGNRAPARQQSSGAEPDLPTNIERADIRLKQLVASGDVAVSGSAGNDRTYRLSCNILDLGLRPATALDRIKKIWNPHCRPPWSDDELAAIVSHAADYQQNEAGSKANKTAAETYAAFVDGHDAQSHDEKLWADINTLLKAETQSNVDFWLGKFSPQTIECGMAQEPPEWILPDYIAQDSLSERFGEEGQGKTGQALDLALTIATPPDAWPDDSPLGSRDHNWGPLPHGLALFYAGEDALYYQTIVIPGWCNARGIDAAKLKFAVVPLVPLLASTDMQAAAIYTAARFAANAAAKVVLGVFDNGSEMAGGLSASDDTTANAQVRFMGAYHKYVGCACLGIAHVGKDGSRGRIGSKLFAARLSASISGEGDKDTTWCSWGGKGTKVRASPPQRPTLFFEKRGFRFTTAKGITRSFMIPVRVNEERRQEMLQASAKAAGLQGLLYEAVRAMQRLIARGWQDPAPEGCKAIQIGSVVLEILAGRGITRPPPDAPPKATEEQKAEWREQVALWEAVHGPLLKSIKNAMLRAPAASGWKLLLDPTTAGRGQAWTLRRLPAATITDALAEGAGADDEFDAVAEEEGP